MRKTLLIAFAMAATMAAAKTEPLTFTVGRYTYRQIAPGGVEVQAASSQVDGTTNTDYVVPATVAYNGKTYTVTAIGTSVFKYKTLTSISLPETIDTIRARAFNQTDCQTAFVTPKSLRYIGESAFRDAHFTSYTLNKGLKYIGKQAFEYISTSVKQLDIPEGVEELGESVFFGNSSLTTINLPSTLKKISKDTFYKCGITSISLPASLDTIPEKAFYNCLSLKTVNMAEGTRYIGSYAFWKCGKLTTVNLPQGLDYIGEGAFMQTGLTSFTVPQNTTRLADLFIAGAPVASLAVAQGNTKFAIKDGAIYSSDFAVLHAVPAKGVTSFAVADGCTDIAGGAFFGSEVADVKLPESLMFILDYAFYQSKLAAVTLPDNILSIGEYSFAYTKLGEVALPHNLYYVPEGAFENCEKLAKVTFPSSIYGIDNYAFAGSPLIVAYALGSYAPTLIDWDEDYQAPFYDKAGTKRTLFVPSGCSDSYYDAYWDQFFTIAETSTGVVKCTRTLPTDSSVYTDPECTTNFILVFDDDVTVAVPNPKAAIRVNGIITDEFITPTSGWLVKNISSNMVGFTGQNPDGSAYTFGMQPGYDYYVVVPDGVVKNASNEYNEQIIIKLSYNPSTGISQAADNGGSIAVKGVYDMSGRKLSHMVKGINIVKNSDGTTRKVLNR